MLRVLWFVLFGIDKETVVKTRRDIWRLPQSGKVLDGVEFVISSLLWPLD